MTTYIIKSSVSLIIMFGLYWFLLRNEKLFVFNRFFLILSVLLSLLLPLISIPVNFRVTPQLSEIVPVINYDKPPTGIQDTYIQSDANIRQPFTGDKSSVISISAILLVFYISGVILFLTSFLRNVYLLIRRSQLSEKISLKGYQIVLTNEKNGPYCFFRNIFLNRDDYFNNKIDAALLDHELEHVRQLHSGDIILIELVKIFYWFNPVHILYTRAIRINHEYLADNGVISYSYDIKSYSDKLLGFIAGRSTISLTSGSNTSFTRKRLIMMLKPVSRRFAYGARIALTICVGVLFFLLISFKESDKQSFQLSGSEVGAEMTHIAIGRSEEIFEKEIKPVKGFVINKYGKYLQGVAIKVAGENIGIVTDMMGRFNIGNVSEDDSLVFLLEEYIPKTVRPVFSSEMLVKLDVDHEVKDSVSAEGIIPTPGSAPLMVIDGVVLDRVTMADIDPNKVVSLNVLQDKNAADIYGDKGKNGVIEIISTRKTDGKKTENKVTSDSKEWRIKTLIIVNGEVYNGELNDIPTNEIDHISFQSYNPSYDKYGEKGKERVIEITTKNRAINKQLDSALPQELLKEYQSIIDKYKRTGKDGKESYYMNFTPEEKARLEFIFFQMSKEQQSKQVFVFIPNNSMVLQKTVPTIEQFESFKDPKTYGVWIDGARVTNESLNKYKNTDFSHIFSSKLEKNATNYGKHIYQVELLTNSYYQNYYNKTISEKGNALMPRVQRSSGSDKK